MNRKGSAQTCPGRSLPVGCRPSSSLPSLLLQAEGKAIVATRLSLAYLLCTSSGVLLLESWYRGRCRVDRGLRLRKLLVQIRKL